MNLKESSEDNIVCLERVKGVIISKRLETPNKCDDMHGSRGNYDNSQDICCIIPFIEGI